MSPRLLARFLDHIAPETDFDRRRRATVLVLFVGLLVGQCAVWAAGHIASGGHLLGAFFASCGVIACLLLYSLTRGFSAARAGHMVLALALVMVCLATYFTGGLRLTNVCPFLTLVIAAIFVHGSAGLGWALGALGAALAFQIAEWQGVLFPDIVAPEDRGTDAFLTWLFAGLLILLYAYLYDSARAVATKRATEASNARDQFLAMLSHEIRTPLHIILAFQAELEHAAPERHAEIMNLLGENSRQLNQLLTDLLELARGERNGFVLQAGYFDPVAIVKTVRHLIDRRCYDKGLKLEVCIADDVPRWVRGDARRLHQVFMNLADNAVKYTDQGTITFELLAQNGGDPGLVWRVSDTGIGIPSAAQSTIFEHFSRVDTSLDRRHGGVGLGLPIVRGLVNAMGGTIAVESEPGTGTTIEVRFPVEAAAAAPEDGPTARTQVALEGACVLVVEDNELNREVAELMLSRLGVEVVSATNGLEAIAAWEAKHPSLILMDIQMPEMDGLTATREIRRREVAGGPRAIILATTGYATASSAGELAEAGVDDVLVKPFAQEQLHKVVADHLSRRLSPTPGRRGELAAGS